MRIGILFSLFSFLSLGFLLNTGCSKDDQTSETAPTLTITSTLPFNPNDILVSAGSILTLTISGQKGSNALQSLAIKEAGVLIQASRIKQGTTAVASNPLPVDGSAFNFTIDLTTHADASKKTYDIVLTDVNGLTDTKSLVVTCLNTKPEILEPAADIAVIRSPGSVVGTVFKVRKGSGDLKVITILLDGKTPADLSGIFLGQLQSPITSNTISLAGNETQAINKELFIKTPSIIGTYIYTIRFLDTNGLEDSRKIQITVGSPVNNLTGILANAAGGSTVGGLDLDSGASTSILSTNPTSTTAEIRDEGLINPPTDKTWRQQISGMNGSEIRQLIPGSNNLPASFTPDAILYKEEIAPLWDRGIALTEKSADGLRLISPKVKTGDLFVVKSGGKVYLIRVSELKITAADDKDQIIFQVKF